jgi:hypothetical protein
VCVCKQFNITDKGIGSSLCSNLTAPKIFLACRHAANPVAALASPEVEGESAGAGAARSSHFVSINAVTTSIDQCLLNPLRTWLLALESARVSNTYACRLNAT